MSLYSKYLLPRLIDLAMRNRDQVRMRREWIPQARGEVLEIGIGSGLNLPFYNSSVKRVRGVDPSRELGKMASKRSAGVPFEIEFFVQSAEGNLPIEDRGIDTAVVTWTLCSMNNPLAALREAKRVLKPDGRLIFVEHGRSCDAGVAAWQDRITPVWKHIAGGCMLNRQVDELVTSAGFQITELRTGYAVGPRPMTYMFQGIAQMA